MGPWGAIIMAVFASAFFVAGLAPTFGKTSPLLLVGFILSAPMVVRGVQRIARPDPPGGMATGRVVTWSTLAAAVGILIVAGAFAAAGRREEALPAVAAVVAAQFVPIGNASGLHRFHWLAVGVGLCAVAGFVLKGVEGTLLSGVGSALALWAGSIFALKRPTYG